MRLPRFHLLQPDTLEEACSILSDHGNESVVLAGGTALLVEVNQRLRSPSRVVSLKRVSGWEHIAADEEGWGVAARVSF